MSKRNGGPLALLLATLASAPSALALELEPGLWEFRVTMKGGLMGNQMASQRQCIRETRLDPLPFTTPMGPCRLGEVEENSRELSWRFSCEANGRTTDGSGIMTAVGDTIRGSVTMNPAMPGAGRSFTLGHDWAGRRIGACL